MKKIVLLAAGICALCAGMPACSDWTETEPLTLVKDDGQTDEYYANLRRWKAETKHDIAFGWFGFWTGAGTSLNNSMIGLPDSMHLVAVWGPWMPSSLSPAKRRDMELVREVKGTKVVATCITGWVGTGLTDDMYDYDLKEQLWGWEKAWNTRDTWNSADPEIRARQEASIRKYARAIIDSVEMAGYDGFDIDNEPTVGGIGCRQELSDKDNFHIMVDELGKCLGPKSGTGKLLVVDGQVYAMHPETTAYFDYFIEQNYSNSSNSSLDGRFERLCGVAEGYLTPEQVAAKYLSTVNFESYSPTGGGTFHCDDGTTTAFLLGQAAWTPTLNGVQYRKGGFGAYHIEMEYNVAGKEGTYPWTRGALRMVHPPKFN